MVYPADGIFNPTYKRDNLDKVIASDVNTVYDEVKSIETHLGVGGVITSDAWGQSGAGFNLRTDWSQFGALRGRLQNIENGLYPLTQNIDGGTVV
jgi:hypothetical protein